MLSAALLVFAGLLQGPKQYQVTCSVFKGSECIAHPILVTTPERVAMIQMGHNVAPGYGLHAGVSVNCTVTELGDGKVRLVASVKLSKMVKAEKDDALVKGIEVGVGKVVKLNEKVSFELKPGTRAELVVTVPEK
jgi:hypothetical protein